MLHEFLSTNRDEVLRRCRKNETKRSSAAQFRAVSDHGVPLFLTQVVETLEHESLSRAGSFGKANPAPVPHSIGRAAALHGAELLRQGCTVDQVVRDYGDVCQTVTEMAIEHKAQISVDEFRTLNRCLDDAIADAVTAFGRDRQAANAQSEIMRDRLETLAHEQRRLIDTALQAFSAVRTGSIGFSGATGTVLMHTLLELRELAVGVAQIALPPLADEKAPAASPRLKG